MTVRFYLRDPHARKRRSETTADAPSEALSEALSEAPNDTGPAASDTAGHRPAEHRPPGKSPSGRTAIIMSIQFGRHRLKLGTGLSIEPKYWNTARGCVRKGYIHETAINGLLERLEGAAVTGYLELLAAGEVSPLALRERLGRRRAEVADIPGVLAALEEYIVSSSAVLRPRTVAIYRTVKRQLREFAETYSIDLGWESLNLLFFQKFTEYLIRIEGLNNTTLDKTIQRLRAFLRHCDEVRRIPMCRDYQRFTRKQLPKGEPSRKIYLTQAELSAIERLDLAGDERLERVRDLFLFLCHVGMRYSDAQSLRAERRKGVRVPVHPTADRIWRRYEGRLPQLSNQKFNDYIKEVCQKTEIDELMVVVDFSGATRREQRMPKYELVSAHTAKRTFVTNLLLGGASIESLCEITGNTPATLQKYIVPTGEDVRRELIEIWKNDTEGSAGE